MDAPWSPVISKPLSSFTTLPAEIRVMVYTELFQYARLNISPLLTRTIPIKQSRLSKLTNILRVNRLCYREAKAVLYKLAKYTLRSAGDISPSRWTPRDRSEIRDLTITESSLWPSVFRLEKLFPSLQKATIVLSVRQPRRPSQSSRTAPAISKIYISMASKILKIHDDMCRKKVLSRKGKDFRRTFETIAADERDWWIFDFLKRRTQYSPAKSQYRLVLQIDLNEAVPLVQYRYRKEQILNIIGIYNPDEESWTFAVNEKRITIAESKPEDHWYTALSLVRALNGNRRTNYDISSRQLLMTESTTRLDRYHGQEAEVEDLQHEWLG